MFLPDSGLTSRCRLQASLVGTPEFSYQLNVLGGGAGGAGGRAGCEGDRAGC